MKNTFNILAGAVAFGAVSVANPFNTLQARAENPTGRLPGVITECSSNSPFETGVNAGTENNSRISKENLERALSLSEQLKTSLSPNDRESYRATLCILEELSSILKNDLRFTAPLVDIIRFTYDTELLIQSPDNFSQYQFDLLAERIGYQNRRINELSRWENPSQDELEGLKRGREYIPLTISDGVKRLGNLRNPAK
jgi:hypothetical protein